MTTFEHPIGYRRIKTPISGVAYGGPVNGARVRLAPHGKMILILGLAVLIAAVLLAAKPEGQVSAGIADFADSDELAGSRLTERPEFLANETAAGSNGGLQVGSISPIFTAEVRYWEPKILAWSAEHGVDPNLTAIIMQIESCGDPMAVSSAGARGLFQVMPFHFEAGEDSFNPDRNALRSLNYFTDRLAQTNGDVGRAFAGYNGGHVAAAGSWDTWVNETQRYYLWSTGLYRDVKSGMAVSPTLDKWLAAGGSGLCRQAAERLGL